MYPVMAFNCRIVTPLAARIFRANHGAPSLGEYSLPLCGDQLAKLAC
jgi:hypothetical protein